MNVAQYCHVEFPFKVFDKVVNKRDRLKSINLFQDPKYLGNTAVFRPTLIQKQNLWILCLFTIFDLFYLMQYILDVIRLIFEMYLWQKVALKT
jgi:hypothetical protein